MIDFKILKKSKKSKARLGILKTPNGEVETPALVAVATLANVKTLSSEETAQAKSQLLICNTYHLHLRPGENIVKTNGGLHKFMNWKKPLMTDSGGFQVFSLGFGADLGVGKVAKYFPGKENNQEKVFSGCQPKSVKIAEDGVYFHSPLDGKKLFLGPKESIKIQEKLGADIIFAFDECTPPLASHDYVKQAVERTHRWADICVQAKKSKQAIFGIIQGSKYQDLREKSARFINSLGFDGFGMGGDMGANKKDMQKILRWIIPNLDESKPRHMLGIGHPEDMPIIIKEGIDIFDCTAPTHYARHGTAFTSEGKLHMGSSKFLKEKKALDKKCSCPVCQNYTRSYISHLIRAKEITGIKLLTQHNLFYFNTCVEIIRAKIKKNLL